MRYANKISALRIITIPFFIYSIINYNPGHEYFRLIALGIFFLAVVSDALDGMIARLKNENTALGPIIDPLADKLLLISTYITLYLKGAALGSIILPLWVVLVVVARDLIMLFGTFLIFVVRQHIKIIPTSWGKLTTGLQMATIVSVLLQFEISFIFWTIAVMLTIISGFDYMRKGLKLLLFEGAK